MLRRGIALALAAALLLVLCGCAHEDLYANIPDPIATITLGDGREMRFQLFFSQAPNTVANFCELANSGFYDGLQIFRILPSVFIQSGDPNNDGTGSADYCIQGEFSANGIENGVSHIRGTISMCRQSGYDTASSQFFILYGDYPEYDGSYAAFGRILDEESYAVLDDLATTASDGSYRPLGVCPTIATIRVNTHGYEFEAAKLAAEVTEEDVK